jgi:hypothetical protein
MTDWETVMKNDLELAFDANQGGEDIELWPLGVEANKVTIKAVVDRNPPMVQGQGKKPKMEIFIRNDATYGRTSIDRTDKVKLAYQPGKTAEAFGIQKVGDFDNACWHLRVM